MDDLSLIRLLVAFPDMVSQEAEAFAGR